MRFVDLVNFVKENNCDWNIDIFDILKDFYNRYSNSQCPIVEQEIIFPTEDFQEPEKGEYTIEDLLKLFS